MFEKMLMDRLHDIAEDGVALGFGFDNSGNPAEHICTYSSAWQTHYWEQKLIFNDPVISFGAKNLGAIRWSDVDLGSKDNAVLQARDFGMNDGIVLSIQVDGERAIAGLATSARPSDAAISEARAIVAALQATKSAAKKIVLTRRQQEILSLIAAGMSAADAAHELDIDVNTVNFHKKAALNRNRGVAKNFNQLLAAACRAALI